MSLLRRLNIFGATSGNGAEVTYANELKVLPTMNLDAFARLRVSNPQTVFDSKQVSDTQVLFWDDQQISGSGTTTTYNTNQASTTIAVSNATAGVRARQTYRHFNYQSGKSQLIIMTAIMGTAGSGITKRLGQFNAKNGLFFQYTNSVLSVNVRTFTSGSAVTTTINQSSWNIDKLDGTGASGITLDVTKTLIYFFDYEWLGVGTIRFGFFVDGVPYYCHSVHNSNVNTLVYMSTPNLPLRYEIQNSGTGTASSLVHICSTVITEGGRTDVGYPRSLNRATNTLTTNNDALIYPLIAIRLKSGYLGALVRLLNFNLQCSSASTYAYYVILNPTVTGTAFSFSSFANSAIEYAYPTNATTIVGTELLTGIATDTNTIQSGAEGLLDTDFVIGSSIAEVSDIVAIGVQRLSGTTETFYSSLNFRETV
jgi:hypothetical protein